MFIKVRSSAFNSTESDFSFFPPFICEQKGNTCSLLRLSRAWHHVAGSGLQPQYLSSWLFLGEGGGGDQTKKATKTKEKIINKTKQKTDKKGPLPQLSASMDKPGKARCQPRGRARPRRARCERRRRRISPGQANCCRATQRADGACSHANQKV